MTVASSLLQDRTVLVVGAQGALGSAAAVACARAGATVVLLGRKVAKLNRVYDAVAAAGAEPLLYPLDLEGASPDDYTEMAQRIGEARGALHGILHCAAEFRGLTPLLHSDPANIARALHVNVTAPVWLTAACIPLMEASDQPAVVVAMDDAATDGQPFWGAYGLAQQARAALVPMWQGEFASSPLRFTGLQPGPMRTALRERAFAEDNDPRTRPAEVYADVCVRLLSPVSTALRGMIERPRIPDVPAPLHVLPMLGG